MIQRLKHTINNNQFLLFFTKLIFLVVVVFVFDFAIGNTLKYFYFKQESGLQYRTTYALEKTKADMLVLGSSRANHHYYPKVFEKGLDMSFYNAGRDGSYIFYQYAMLKGILKRYTPKIVILDFMKKEFAREPGSYDRLSSLLPYYDNHPEIRPIIRLKSKFEEFKLLSQIYPYNSSMLTIAIGNTVYNKKREQDIDGYIPLKNEWSASLKSVKVINYEFDSLKVKTYQSFINDCRNAGVKLYIVCSPSFEKDESPDKSVKMAKEIALKNNVAFIDFSNNPIFFNNQLFTDIDHLNNTGAIKFSEILVGEINSLDHEKSGDHLSITHSGMKSLSQ